MDVAGVAEKKGRVVFVGTGLKAIGHMTLESVAEIKNADAVFYHAADGVTASYIQSLNRETHDLYRYYGNGKDRNATYLQMAEVILRDVRKGKNVVGVFYGHPGVFVKPIRRVLGIARKEGHEAFMYPGITTMDYLFADLEVDPSKNGCQILEASDMFIRNRRINTDGHVIILQIGAFGDGKFTFKGYPKKKLTLLIEYLIELYGPSAACTLYRGSNFPGVASHKVSFRLQDLLDGEVQANHVTGVTTLYLPPSALKPADARRVEELGYGTAGTVISVEPGAWETSYTDRMVKGLEGLDDHRDPEGYIRRQAGPALLGVMNDLATDPSSLREYRADPGAFARVRPGLSDLERRALASASIRRIGFASTVASDSAGTVYDFINNQLNTNTSLGIVTAYVNAVTQSDATPDQADTAANTYISGQGFSAVNVTDVANAVTSIQQNSSYLTIGGPCQTFDSTQNASLLFHFYNINGTLSVQVAMSGLQLTDISSSVAWNSSSNTLAVLTSTAFPYTGSIVFAPVSLTDTSVNTTGNTGTFSGWGATVSLTSTTAASISSTGLLNGYFESALTSSSLTPVSCWCGTYNTNTSDNTTGTLTVDYTNSVLTISIGGQAASNIVYDAVQNVFQCTDSQSNNYELHFADYYFPVYNANDTGINFYGYVWPSSGERPTTPGFFGAASGTPSTQSNAEAIALEVWSYLQMGLTILVIFAKIRNLYQKSQISDALMEANDAEAARLARIIYRPNMNSDTVNSQDAPNDDDSNDNTNDSNDNNDDNNNNNENDSNDNTGDDDSDDDACFLTTAVVHAMGMPDDSEPLRLVRYLRDEKMKGPESRRKISLYEKVSPLIVSRSEHDDWIRLWRSCIRPVTALVKRGEYRLAEQMYTLATVRLIRRKATRVDDVSSVNDVYAYGLGYWAAVKLPYLARYVLLKVGLCAYAARLAVVVHVKQRALSRLLWI